MHKPRTVDGILKKLKEKSDIGGYLYRGEPEHYQENPILARSPQTCIVSFWKMKKLMLKTINLI